MLSKIEDILAWFDDNGGKTNPYWVLYASQDKPDSQKRRGINYETSDVTKSRELLDTALKRFAPMGGAYYLTVSDKAKDNAPSAGVNIIFGAAGANGQTFSSAPYAMVNGVPAPFTTSTANNDEVRRLEVEKTKLEMQLEFEKYKAEQAKINGNGMGGLLGWLQGLSSHKNFDPNTPFNMIGGFLGNIMGVPMNFAANPQGLPPPQVQVGFSTDVPQAAAVQETLQTPPSVSEPEKEVKFTYNVQEIAMNYHKFCESMQIPLENRNSFLGDMNVNIEKMPQVVRQQFVAQMAAKQPQNV